VEFVYEPPQQGSQDELVFERGTPQEAQVGLLGSIINIVGLLGFFF
jgi:hypothetical protein